MLLSDRSIKEALAQGRLRLAPYQPDCLQPASYDLHLADQLLTFAASRQSVIDIHRDNTELIEKVELADPEQPFLLHPGEFVLGSTVENIELAADLVGRLEGKSSLGRLGLAIHSTAGFIDPGWKGNITLELSNLSRLPITLYAGMKIGQISFMELTTPAERPYGSVRLGSKYQGQTEPTPSRSHQDYGSKPDNQ